jgi:integrase
MLNAAVREGLVASNPLAHVRLDKPVRPHPVIWTDERVAAWRRDGIRPPVVVWTLRQLITFLAGVENDRLAALWWLIALRGLRRGEAAALDRDDLDSKARELTISRQLVALPGELYCGPPKSRASVRTIALDEAGTRRLVDQAVRQTVELLRHQFAEQRRGDARARAGPGWRHGHAMFTYADERPIRPEYLTHRFHTLIKQLDLPPIRLYDLRHGTATLALASHTDLKVIQQMLGHSSIVTTADTLHQRPARHRSPRGPGHRRHGHQGGPQHPRSQVRRGDRDPCPASRHCLRLLPDMSSRSSTACTTGVSGQSRGRAASHRGARE